MELVALDRSSWFLKSVYNRLLQNACGYKDVLKVEYNDPHKFASKLHVFSFICKLTRPAIYGSQKFLNLHKKNIKILTFDFGTV